MSKYNIELHVETKGEDDLRNEIFDAMEVAAKEAASDDVKIDVDRVTKVRRWPPFDVYRYLMTWFLIVDLIGKKWWSASICAAFLLLFLSFDYRDYRKNSNWKV